MFSLLNSQFIFLLKKSTLNFFNLPLIIKSMLFLIFWLGSFAVPIGYYFRSARPGSFAVLESFGDPYITL